MRKIFLLVCSLYAGPCWAQDFRVDTGLEFRDEAGSLFENAWTGGMETPQYAAVDVNQDGRGDVIVFDNQSERFLVFLNTNRFGEDSAHLVYAPQWNGLFKDCGCRDWAVFADYDCDGLPDLFCRTQTAEVSVFRQEPVGTDSIQFRNTIPAVRVQRTTTESFLAVAATDIPALVDVDHDGDLDFFAFGVGSNFIEFAKNEAMERLGRCDTLLYRVETSCWGFFRESDEDNTAFVADTTLECPIPADEIPRSRAIKHVGSTTLLLDLDADSVFDALIGDTAFDEVYALFNAGTPEYAFMDSVERNFPSSSLPISVSTFPACFYLDVTQDGIRDLLVAPHAASSFDNTLGTWLYTNEGTDDAPDFAFSNIGFIQGQTFDVGTYSYPAIGDVNGDGLMDILVGNRGYFEPRDRSLEPSLAFIENVGTTSSPVFQLVDRNFLGIRAASFFAGLTEIRPAIGDVDGDQVPDILLGHEMGTIYYFKGEVADGATEPSYSFVTDTLGGIDVGRNSSPILYDVDGDQDLDLLIGNRDGYIQYHENLGVSDVPEEAELGPQFQLVTETWGGVRILDRFGGEFSRAFAHPWLIDIDQDEEVELLLGGVEGEIEVYEGVANALTDSLEFVGVIGGLDLGTRVVPTGAFLDDSGFPTLLVGDEGGGLQLLTTQGGSLPTSQPPSLLATTPFTLSPNPVSERLAFVWNGEIQQPLTGRIVDLYGRVVWERKNVLSQPKIDIQHLSSGYYFFQVEQGARVFSEQFIKR